MRAYQAKLGIDPSDPAMQKQMRQFLAPYADVLKQVSAKSDELKGYPLKTVLRISYGGEHCAAVKNQPAGGGNVVADASQAAGDAAAASATSAAGSAAGAAAGNMAKNSVGGSVFSSAANAFGSKLASGFFNKKKADAPPPAPSGASGNAPAPGMIQAAQISIETTSIDASTVPPNKFEIPSGWKKVEPKAKETGAKEFSCPAAGT
jgi:hypothetical protein